MSKKEYVHGKRGIAQELVAEQLNRLSTLSYDDTYSKIKRKKVLALEKWLKKFVLENEFFLPEMKYEVSRSLLILVVQRAKHTLESKEAVDSRVLNLVFGLVEFVLEHDLIEGIYEMFFFLAGIDIPSVRRLRNRMMERDQKRTLRSITSPRYYLEEDIRSAHGYFHRMMSRESIS